MLLCFAWDLIVTIVDHGTYFHLITEPNCYIFNNGACWLLLCVF